ncbi:DNA adenine methylase [Rhodoferax sp.]|uniref:DNA adenine methylase n=1 Tax=Rhodoferax sp. TaxID=50421 RepID=UPI00374D0132
MPVTDTPLRYPGGKTQMTPLVQDIMQVNNLAQCVYCEPFAGGAGIACRLLVEGAIAEAWINDIDPSIYNFWDCVLTATDDLCELIQTTPITMEEWRRQREIQQQPNVSKLALGFSTLFLNRTNRSGILKGGVIGGQEQKGNYPLDCRFNKVDLIRKVRRLSIYRDQIRLTSQDARSYIDNTVCKLPTHSLVNIDPPYFDKGPELYTSFYKADDHAALAKAVRAIKKPWMLTYDDVPAIQKLYAGLPGTRKALNYTAQVKKIGVELLVMSPNLIPPLAINLEILPIGP